MYELKYGLGQVEAYKPPEKTGTQKFIEGATQIYLERLKAQQAAAQAEQLQQGVDTASTAAGIPGVKDLLENAANPEAAA